MRHDRISHPIGTLVTRAIGKLCAASFLARTLVLGILTITISGVAHALAQPAHHNSDATDLVDSLVAGEADPDLVPGAFAGDMGYSPASASGTLRNPNGGCSTPGDIGPERFAGACQTHDLGYDLLRYAEIEGRRLDAKARFELDLRLYVDLLQACETPTCSLTATAYYCAVSANSIRQGYKTPHAEPTTPWMALAVSVLGVSVVGGLPVMRDRFDRAEFRPHRGDAAPDARIRSSEQRGFRRLLTIRR